MKKSSIAAASLLLFASSGAAAVRSEDLLPDQTISLDLASMSGAARARELEGAERRLLGGRYLIADHDLVPGGSRRLILICERKSASGSPRGIQILIADCSGERPKVAQRVKLGDGDDPELSVDARGEIALVRVVRSGGNIEGIVFDVDAAGQKLTETFRVSRTIVKRTVLDIRATMQANAKIEFAARRPEFTGELDLEYALEALIEDALYQKNGRPIPALVNLICERVGWEGEAIYRIGDKIAIDVGLSIATSAHKPVAVARVRYERSADGRWQPVSMIVEPFMAYQG